MPQPSSRNVVSRETPSPRSSIELSRAGQSSVSEKRPRTLLARTAAAVRLIHLLHLYGAAGIASFGWALGEMLGFDAAPFLPLWFCGALLVYNLDRLKPDPSDALNIPERQSQHACCRNASFAVAAVSACLLVALPARMAWAGHGLLLALTPAAAVISLSYSFPIFGFRFKDVPLVKTLFAPAVVLLAYFVPPLLRGELRADFAALAAAACSGCLLLFNMVLCDERDVAGDRALGTRSLPVILGEKNTRRFLAALLACGVFLAWLRGWTLLAAATAVYASALLFALRKPRRESFYEWFVEGILFLPALSVLAKHLAASV
jgi:4-hydroxybenzoate polyprenyltransferase